MADKTAIGTSSVTGDVSTNNTTTPSINNDATEMVSKTECFDADEIVENVVKNSKSKSPEKSEPAQQQNQSQSEANNQRENKLPEGNSDHGKNSQKDVQDDDAKKIDKTTDIVLTKEDISMIVHNIVSQVEKLFANKF